MRLITILVLSLAFFSCKNDKTSEIVDSVQAKAIAEYYFLDVYRQVLNLVPEFVATGKSSDSLISITTASNLSDSNYPKLIKVNFGDYSRADASGIIRRGTVLVDIQQKEVLKSFFTIEFQDFFLNETRLLGTIESQYASSGNKSLYTLSLRDSSKCMNSNGTMSFSGVLSLSQLSGETTVTVLDDVFSYTENTLGQDFLGRSYESSGDCNLDFSCKYFFTGGSGVFQAKDEESLSYKYSSSCNGVTELVNSEKESLFFQLK